MSQSKCPKDKIINPATGRCVSKSGKIGQALLAKKKCPPAKIVNPETGKCVSKLRKIGKSLTPSKKKNPSKKSSSKKCSAGRIVNPATGRCVYKTGKIGQSLTPSKKKGSPKKKSSLSKKSAKKISPELAKILKPNTKCEKGKKYNPKTGKCVLSNGATGKKLVMSLEEENKIMRKRMTEQLKQYIKSKGGKGYSHLDLEELKFEAKTLYG